MSASGRTRSASIRLLACLAVAGLAGGGYYYRDHAALGSTGRVLDPAALPGNLDPSFEILNGCRVVRNAGNDGDSFRVRHMGEEYTFRLYFVDCPETSDDFPDRLDHQGKYFGGLGRSDIIAVGKAAGQFTGNLLADRKWVIFTRWEKVMKSYRYHAFVLVENEDGSTEYLCETLVRHGLARIYTLGATLPDGRSREAFGTHLKALEREAKAAKVGAWRN